MWRLLLLCLGIISFSSQANVWYWQDQQGQMHFSDNRKSAQWRLLMQRSYTQQMPERFRIKHPQTDTLHWQRPLRDRSQPTARFPFQNLIRQAAIHYQLSPQLLRAVIMVESSAKHRAISKAGAMGLMQLMPATAKRFNVKDPFSPAENINAGSRYLRILLDEFKSTRLALAAYNAGENTVRRYNGIPPYPETQRYVKKVMSILAQSQSNS